MRKYLEILIAVLLLPLLFPLVLFALATYLMRGLALYVIVWICWCARGKHVLLVYSDSPIWHDYKQGYEQSVDSIECDMFAHVAQIGIQDAL